MLSFINVRNIIHCLEVFLLCDESVAAAPESVAAAPDVDGLVSFHNVADRL